MGLFGRDDRSDIGKALTRRHATAGRRTTRSSGSTITLIAKTAHVKGEIKGAGEVRIEGTVKGKIDCSATVIVAPGGRSRARSGPRPVTIAGKVKGDVFASQKIELTPTAEVEGDITSPRILIREGANFEGQVFMTGKQGGKAPEPTTKAQRTQSPRRNRVRPKAPPTFVVRWRDGIHNS